MAAEQDRLPGDTTGTDSDPLFRDLAERVDGEVRFDTGTPAAYSTDVSNYRRVPTGRFVSGRAA